MPPHGTQVIASMRSSATLAHSVGVGVDHDPVTHLAGDEPLEDPGQVRGVDARHGRARADERVEADDRLVGRLVVETVHEVDLGGDADDRTGGGRVDGL